MFEIKEMMLALLDSHRKYLVNAVSLHSILPSKALGGVCLRAVLGQLALVVMTHSRLSTKTTQFQNIKTVNKGTSEEGRGREKSSTAGNTASGLKW